MKASLILPSICAVTVLSVTWSQAVQPGSVPFPGNSGDPGNKPPPGQQVPKPGNSHKTTRVDFKNQNNGWGNGDQEPPGNSGDNNNAENSDREPPPGIIKKESSATPEATGDEVVARRVK